MKLKNTKTRQIEEFKPLNEREVKVYYCGPTVYNYVHIGNLRAYIFEDVVVKTLRFLGYNVKTVMNITDIDDKTIRDSQKEGINLLDFTKKYTKIFLSDIEKLNIQPADTITPISEIIPEMVRMIQTMINRKNAYLSEDGSVYFDIATSKKYGQLANLDMENLKQSVRIDNDEYDKDNAADFVLWKSWKESDGECAWFETFTIPKNNKNKKVLNLLCHSGLEKVNWFEKSREATLGYPESMEKDSQKIPVSYPKGHESTRMTTGLRNVEIISENEKEVVVKIKGRPGWHIECSACNMKHFGAQIDIHMGGIDNLFPHHQNEVAQTEACTRKEFSKYWMHCAHLTVDGKKMSKSANNFYTIENLEEKYSPHPLVPPCGVSPLPKGEGIAISRSVLYRALRLSFMNAKYASQVDFSFSKLEANFSVIKSIDETVKNMQREMEFAEEKITSKQVSEDLQDFLAAYMEQLEDDFNIPEALAVYHNFLKYINTGLREKLFSKSEIQALFELLKTFDSVLSILDLEEKNEEIPAEIEDLFQKRNEAKKQKDFATADTLRDELLERGYKIVDTRDGSFLERK